mgnify:FL=1
MDGSTNVRSNSSLKGAIDIACVGGDVFLQDRHLCSLEKAEQAMRLATDLNQLVERHLGKSRVRLSDTPRCRTNRASGPVIVLCVDGNVFVQSRHLCSFAGHDDGMNFASDIVDLLEATLGEDNVDFWFNAEETND